MLSGGSDPASQINPTAVADVYAAGDCGEAWHALLEQPAYLPWAPSPTKQGQVAGGNAAGRDAVFAGSLGSLDAEVAKRCDVAAAIHRRMGVADLLDLDLTYMPPLSVPWIRCRRPTARMSAEASTSVSAPPGPAPSEPRRTARA